MKTRKRQREKSANGEEIQENECDTESKCKMATQPNSYSCTDPSIWKDESLPQNANSYQGVNLPSIPCDPVMQLHDYQDFNRINQQLISGSAPAFTCQFPQRDFSFN